MRTHTHTPTHMLRQAQNNYQGNALSLQLKLLLVLSFHFFTQGRFPPSSLIVYSPRMDHCVPLSTAKIWDSLLSITIIVFYILNLMDLSMLYLEFKPSFSSSKSDNYCFTTMYLQGLVID